MGAAFKRKRWRGENRVRVDLNGMMAGIVGAAGVSETDLDALLPRLADVQAALEKRRRAGALAFAELPYAGVDLKRTLALADEVRGQFDDLIVLGAGGSVLGARALCAALRPPGHVAAPAAPGEMRVQVADAIDPRWFAALLDGVDPRRTLFNVIGTSGDAPETMSQFMIVRERLLRELGAVEYKRHVIVTTDATRGALRQIVNDEGFRNLAVPAHVAGAWSVLTAVGLFPAACAGVDVAEMLAGAADMDTRCRVDDARGNPALLHAGTLYLAGTCGRQGDVVLRPYAQALVAMGDWFGRLWAESVAQAADPRGASASMVVFVRVEEHATLGVPKSYEDIESIAYLGGHDLGTLLNLQQQAAEIALGKAGRPSATLVCPRINPFVIGAVIYLLETEAAVVASLLGAEAALARADETRQLTCGLAGRAGYESGRAEAQRWLARKEARYVL